MKKISKGVLMTALILGAVAVQDGVHAAGAEFMLDEMVITASRVATNKVDTPANISVITQADFEENSYADVAEALRDVPGVNVLGSGAKGTSMGQDVILLNGDSRVLVLVDGRRINLGSNGASSADWLPPVNAIERVEVLKGAGSAIYGTDAVGGVINIITKNGSDIDDYASLKVAGGSWHTEQYSLAAGGATAKGLGVFVAADKERRGSYKYKDIDGRVKDLANSQYNTESVNVKLDQALGNDDRLTLTYEHLNAEGGSPFGYSSFGVTDEHKRLNNNVAVKYAWDESTVEQGYVQLYKNYQHAKFLSPKVANQSDFTDTTSGITAQKNFVINDNNELTAGLEYYKTEVDNAVMYKGKRDINNKALFVEDRWEFADAWQLNTGLRYDKHSRYGSEFTPRLAVNKKLTEESNIYFSWGKIFNAPTTDDLFWDDPYSKGNPDLDAETGDVWSLGYNGKLADKTNFSASAFYSDVDDAIDWVWNASTGLTKVENVNKEKRRGLELTVNHEFDAQLSAYASYTYVQVKQDKGYGFNRDNSARPNIYRAGLKYKNDAWLLTTDLTAVSGQSRAQFTDSNYVTLDLGAQYQLQDNARLFVKGYNLTNARYQEYGKLYSNGTARYPMPSRSFIIGAEYTF